MSRNLTQKAKDKVLLVLLLAHFALCLGWSYLVMEVIHIVPLALFALVVPVAVFRWKPGSVFSRSAIAVSFMIYSSALIHLSGGLIELHFHVFAALALLSIYYDWKPLAVAAAVICLHHLAAVIIPDFKIYHTHQDIVIYLVHVMFVLIMSGLLGFQSYNISRSVRQIQSSTQILIEKDLLELTAYLQGVAAGNFKNAIKLESQPIPVLVSDELGVLTRQHNKLVAGFHAIANNAFAMGTALESGVTRSQANLQHLQNLCRRILTTTKDESQFFLDSLNARDKLPKNRLTITEQIHSLSRDMMLASVQLDALQNQLEEKIEEQSRLNANLEKMTEVKNRFFASVSHDLRTPLTAIVGYSEILSLGMAGTLNPEQQHMSNQLLQNADTMMQIINDILDFSKIEAGHLKVQLEPVVTREAVSKTINQIRVLAEANQIGIIEQCNDADIILKADTLRLQQVLLNLLSNAIKYTPRQGQIVVSSLPLVLTANNQWFNPKNLQFPQISLEVNLPLKPGLWLGLQVADTGIGIPAEKLGEIFGEYVQLEDKPHYRGNSTGLGLSIARQLTRLMGGELVASSVPGQGSTFTILLPACLDAPVMLPLNSADYAFEVGSYQLDLPLPMQAVA